jgi:O-antigen/teichoic acid export membrane protein
LVYWAGNIDPFGILPPLRFKLHALKELFSVSMFSLLLGISGIFAMRIDNMVIAANLTMVEVAIFGIVFRLYNMVSEVIDKLTVGLMPLMSKYFSENNMEVTRKIYTRGTALIQFSSMMLLIWVTAYYEPIFGYFSHGEIPIEPTRNLMFVVIVIIWSRCIVRPASNYLFVFNQRVLVISASIVSTILNIVLSLALVKQFGIFGVALGTMIPMLLEHHLALILQSTLKAGVSMWSFLKQVYIDTIPALLACAGFIKLVKMQNITTGYLYMDMFLIGGAAFMIGGMVWLLTAATFEEKQLLLERISPKLVRIGIRFPGFSSGKVTAVEE